MANIPFSPGRIRDLPLTGRPFAAVDLGFGASKTCGIVVRGVNGNSKPILRSFGGCVSYAASLITDSEIDAVIIEAPLSGIFNSDGDPQWRQPFERRLGIDKTERRYWYTQPGSSVCLAAAAFFSRLSRSIQGYDKAVHVFEGFFTFKPKGKSDHCQDAVRLADAAQDASLGVYYEVVAPAGGQLLTVLSLIEPAGGPAFAPAVIACRG